MFYIPIVESMRSPMLVIVLFASASIGCPLGMPSAARAQSAQTTLRELEELRRLLQQQQQTISDLQKRLQELQGQ
jgi:septal ring factor EnvC (AmiA/AmiB activator)